MQKVVWDARTGGVGAASIRCMADPARSISLSPIPIFRPRLADSQRFCPQPKPSSIFLPARMHASSPVVCAVLLAGEGAGCLALLSRPRRLPAASTHSRLRKSSCLTQNPPGAHPRYSVSSVPQSLSIRRSPYSHCCSPLLLLSFFDPSLPAVVALLSSPSAAMLGQ